ncbi:MAG: NAD(P)-dependent glycerol-3-phosphate dehydrogenase [Erysipelotrichaceae bacterium]|nr:NAD(P)-dependent glycerol-3-phosphate dehydrogenase [Erysipelotrichaceae bacterium]MDY5252312.1 NAD(P)H-dependent glycerol-3-phosphate dehydrogenase [Erysipelotrichaceae bacterium]
MKIVVLGSGSWGCALAQVLADNEHDVKIWGINEAEVNDINLNHQNSRYFETTLHPKLKAYQDIKVIEDADVLLLSIPSSAIEEVCLKINEHATKPAIIINVAKGFHPLTHERLSVVIDRSLSAKAKKAVVSLIGPSHAEEVILRLLTCVNAVSNDLEAAQTVQSLFSNSYFRVYTNDDVIGAEIGVALKNIMALASGMLTGVGQGDNAKAALMTRGLAEMTRYGTYFGGKAATYLGLDGVGDLIVTCTSLHSRNFQAGLEIGKTNNAKAFMENNTKTVEGIKACKIVYEEAQARNIDMPITTEIYRILYEGKDCAQALSDLMNRTLKKEY